MNSLNFDSGYKEFCINGDENRVIRFNPADYSMLKRFSDAKKNIMLAVTEIEKDVQLRKGTEDELEEAAKLITNINEIINSQINYIFNSDVAKTAFGNQSPISTVKGKFLFERFLDAAGPYIEKEIKAEQAASQKRIDKYTKQVR
ncbi:hypothetical protein HNQ56_003736 [Anaerotaenia torta]|uniref:hypothetical protein n=1 Tax=Anaerotaenia torta TaxID=433293 RepID=UPI003D1BCE7B